jgi:pimeloyl-ACP methyl ester carboxylesterase
VSVRIAHELHGSATDRPPMLLTHGYGQSRRMWDRNVPALEQQRLVVTWDMPGHGVSEAPDDPAAYTHVACLAEMESLLDEVGAERAVLGGQSLGGFLSLRFALEHPERVAALVVVDAGPGFRDRAARAEWNQAARERPDGPVRELLVQYDSVVLDSLDQISAPVLVAVGSEDRLFLPAADVMAQRIPHARKLVLDGAGHMANVDAANEFNAAVNDFLEGL